MIFVYLWVDETDVGLYSNISSVEIDNPDIIDNLSWQMTQTLQRRLVLSVSTSLYPNAVKANQRPHYYSL